MPRLLALSVAILSLLAQSAGARKGPSSSALTLESDRTIRVRVLADLNSRTARDGEEFRVATVDDVLVGGVLVLPKDSPGKGSVVGVRRARSFWRRGRLQIAVGVVFAPDDTPVPVVLPNGSPGITPIYSGRHGPFGFFADNVTIPCGTIATVLVSADIALRGYSRADLPPRPHTPSCPHPPK